MKIVNLKKKILSAFAVAAGSLVSFAQEQAAQPIIEPAQVKDIFTQAQTNMTTLVSNALPVIIAFVVGGLTIWAAIALIGVLKRAFGAGKGR